MTCNRELMLKAMNLVKGALASQSYIPSLTHVALDGEFAMAYNDITAIRARCPVDLELCLPGDLLLKCLNNLTAAEVVFQRPDATNVVLAAGRSKLKLATLPLADFPFDFPNDTNYTGIGLNEEMLRGIEQCLISVGNDPSHPEQMGITLEEAPWGCTMYSTDNFTLSRRQCAAKIKLRGSIPVILPTFFCNQLLALAKAFSDDEITLEIRDGSVTAHLGSNASIFTKMVVDLEPLDFQSIVDRNVSSTEVQERLAPIPDSFDSAFSRALLMLSDVQDKSTRITPGATTIKLLSASSTGEADDTMTFAGKCPKDPFYVDPALVSRASKVCTHIAFMDRVLVLFNSDQSFLHMVAHCASK